VHFLITPLLIAKSFQIANPNLLNLLCRRDVNRLPIYFSVRRIRGKIGSFCVLDLWRTGRGAKRGVAGYLEGVGKS